MIEIPKDLAERIYSQYEITVTDPMPFDEFFTIKEVIPGAGPVIKIKDVHRHAYERAIVKPEGQLFWLNKLQGNAVDLKEPYDVGFFNALSFCMLIFSDKAPEYVAKPKSQSSKSTAAKKRLGKIRKDYAEEIKALKDEIKELKKAG